MTHRRSAPHVQTGSLIAGLALAIGFSTACSSHRKDDGNITIRGRLALPADATGGTLLVGISGQPFEQLTADPIQRTLKFIATTDFSGYELKVPSSALQNIDVVQIFGLLHRDPSLNQVPSLTRGDLVGFYSAGNSLGFPLTDRGLKTLAADLKINRVYQDRRVAVPIAVSGDFSGTVMAGIYCGEIRSMSAQGLDQDNVIFVRKLSKDSATKQETLDFPLFSVTNNNRCYAFAFADANNNGTIDPGEKFGFSADAKSSIPTTFDLGQPPSEPLKISLDRAAPAPSSSPIVLKGSLAITSELRVAMKRFFVVAARQESLSMNPDQIGQNILAFRQVDANAVDYELDVTSAGLKPGDKVTTFALGDANDQGLPALVGGDAIGFAIKDNSLVTKAIQYGINSGFDLSLSQRYYDGSAKIAVTVDSDYRGPMMLFAYAGPINLDGQNLDPTKVVGTVAFRKTDARTQAELPIYGLGQPWPMKVYVVGLFDANNNQKPDPGESLILQLGSDGVPTKLTVNNGDRLSAALNYTYTLPIPSGQDIAVSGKFQFASNNTQPFVHIMVAQGQTLDDVMNDPITHVRASQKVPSSARQYYISLANTSLRAGDQVFVIGVTSDGASDFPRITTDTLLGVHTSGQSVGDVLKAGVNSGIDLIIDRSQYKDKISLVGTVTSSYRGPIFATLFAGNPMDLINQTFNPSNFVAFTQSTKVTDQFSVNFQTLVANRPLPLTAIPMLLEDANGNGRADPGERVWFAFDPKTNGPLTVTLAPGLIQSFTFDQVRDVPAPSPTPLSIAGNVRVGAIDGPGHLYVLVLDGELPSLAPDQLAQHVHIIQEVGRTGGPYTIDLANSGLKPGDDVMVLGLFDRRDRPNGFPQLSSQDLIGIHTSGSAMAQTLKPGVNSGMDLTVDRTVFDGQAQISGSILASTPSEVILAIYAGEIDSITSPNLDLSKVVGFTRVPQGINVPFSVGVTPIGRPFPISAYVIAFADSNGNQQLDPGETIYFYSNRSDHLPEKVTIAQGQGLALDLNQSFTTQLPGGQPMSVSGTIAWQAADQNGAEPAYLFIAKGTSFDAITTDPLHSIKYFKKLEGRPGSFSASLAETDLKPGDPVLVGVLLDKDRSMSPTNGDVIGVALSGLKGFAMNLDSGGLSGLNVAVNRVYYGTNKSVDVIITGSGRADYSGRILALLYQGTMTSMDLAGVDPNKVIAFADFTKSANKSTFSLPLLPTTALPVSNATLLVLFDANGNGQPDAGEVVGFASAPTGGFPQTVSFQASDQPSLTVGTYMTLMQPSGTAITAKATIDSAFNVDTAKTPVMVGIFAEAPLASLAANPLQYLKAFSVVGNGNTAAQVDLSHSDLKPGDRITAFAFNQPPGSNAPVMSLSEGGQIGILLNNSTLDTATTLAAADNQLDQSPYTLQINRIFYQHNGSITVNVDGSSILQSGDPLVLAAYQIDTSSGNAYTIAAQLTAIDYSKVVGYLRTSYTGPKAYNFSIFPALAPGLVDPSTRKMANIAVVAFRDSNGNGKPDSGEAVAVYADSGSPLGVSLKTIALAQNILTGSVNFGATVPSASSIANALPLLSQP